MRTAATRKLHHFPLLSVFLLLSLVRFASAQLEQGNALSFDGVDDYLLIADNPDLSGGPGKSLTVEMWIYPTDTTRESGLITKWLDYAWKDWGFVIDHGVLKVSIENNSDDWEYTAGTVNPGEWTHVAFTYDDISNYVRVFINGVESGAGKQQLAGMPDTNADIYIGKRGYYDAYFYGIIDEVRIWDIPLSDTEIAANMNQALVGNEAGLIGYWRFDEGSGQEALDLTASANPAQLGSAAVADANDPAWFVLNGAPFVQVLAPNGGEHYFVDNTVTVGWSASNLITDVMIEFSPDGGASWQTVVASTPNDGQYDWTAPALRYDSGLIRISDALDGTPADTSDATFDIVEVGDPGQEMPNLNPWIGPFPGGLVDANIVLDAGQTKLRFSGTTKNTGVGALDLQGTFDAQGILPAYQRIYFDDGTYQDIYVGTFEFADHPGHDHFHLQNFNVYRLREVNADGSVGAIVASSDKLSFCVTDSDPYDLSLPGAPQQAVYSCEKQGISVGWSDLYDYTTFGQWIVIDGVPDGEYWLEFEVNPDHVVYEDDYADNIGELKISFDKASQSVTILDYQAPTLYTQNVNAGGVDFAGGGRIWATDQPFVAGGWGYVGGTANSTLDDIIGTSEDELYQAVRDGMSSYQYTVPAAGQYRVDLHFAELTYTNPGERVFDVLLEGQVVLDSLDLVNEVGFETTFDRTYIVDVTDGVLNVDFAAEVGEPTVAAILVAEMYQEEPFVQVSSPNGGEEFLSASTQIISWTSSAGDFDFVDIDYSLDNGASWTNIVTATANDGGFDWTLPAAVSDSCLIRITDSSGAYTDVSNGVFSIVDASLTVLAPNGGETLVAGTVVQITWSSLGDIPNVKLQYSLDDGASWTVIAASTPNDGSYDWSVPTSASDSCYIQVSDAADDVPADMADSQFSISAAGLTVTSPNGGESFVQGTVQTITWTTTGTVANVNIDYSLDNGATWTAVATSIANSDSFDWAVPAVESSAALVRVSDAADAAVFDNSDAVFSIILPLGDMQITINVDDEYDLYVNGEFIGSDVNWDQAQTYVVPLVSGNNVLAVSTVNPGGAGGLIAEVTVNGEVVLITDSNWVYNATEETGWQNLGFDDSAWTPAVDYGAYGVDPWKTNIQGFPAGSTAHWIWETDSRGPGAFYRGSFFVGVPGPVPQVTSFAPTSGREGDAVTVTGVNFTDATSVTFAGVPVSGFTVNSDTEIVTTVPVGAGTGKITVSNSNGSGSSVDDFVVIVDPAITVTAPNGGEVWVNGIDHTITWTSRGGVANVDLEYSLDAGVTWNVIATSVADTGSFVWSVPVIESASVLVRVTDSADPAVSDMSDAVFSLITNLGDMQITINVDDEYDLYVNGEFIGSDVNWDQAQTYVVPLVSGNNVLAVSTVNPGGAGGLIAEVTVNGEVVLITDSNWVYNATEETGWQNLGFDDSAWTPAVDYGAYGVDPWKTNIQGFPTGSTAHWIWETDSRGPGAFYRGSFVIGEVTPPPSIASFAPTAGLVGDAVTITGLNFTGATQVLFNGTAVTGFTVVSDSAITTTVPAGATSGPLSVVTSAGTGTSASDFTVTLQPTIIVNTPNGGESWAATTSRLITWTSTGTVDTVNIEFSVDGGTTWSPVQTNLENTGSYFWTIPGSVSSTCLIRIFESQTGQPADTSDATFSIVDNPFQAAELRTPFELVIEAANSVANPYQDGFLTATFTSPSGTFTIPGFWDGGTTWRVRISPDETGTWSYSTTSDDPGLQMSGTFTVNASAAKGGITAMSGFPYHFQYEDGTPFWWFGETNWAAFRSDSLENLNSTTFQEYVTVRASQGFNYLHGNLLAGANEGGNPFEGAVGDKVNPAFWQEVDARVQFLNDNGLTAGLVLAWKDDNAGTPVFDFDWLSFPDQASRTRFCEYVAARYSAYNVVWIISGEYNEVPTSQPSSTADWTELANAVRDNDPHGRLMAIHGTGSVATFAAEPWMSFGDYMQTYTDLHTAVINASDNLKPVVNAEYAYFLRDVDGDGVVDKENSATLKEFRDATWDIVMAGGYFVSGFGTTYLGGEREAGPFDVNAAVNDSAEAALTYVDDFFTALQWWRFNSADNLVSGNGINYALSKSDSQFVVYTRGNDTGVTLTLSNAVPELYAVQLFDPRSGVYTDLGSKAGGTSLELTPNDTLDWVYLVTRTTPVLTLATPNGGEDWQVGSTQTISWVPGAVATDVKLEYSLDNGLSWTTITDLTANDGAYDWVVPDFPSTTALLRVSEAPAGALSDVSDASFTISALPPPELSFTDITISAGLAGPQEGGHSSNFADVDNDGLPDLYTTMLFVPNELADLFYRNTGGNVFSEEAASRGIADIDGGSHGAVWADLDNDGDFDLYNGTTESSASGTAMNQLYANDSTGQFTDVTDAAGLPFREWPTRGVLAFDMDRDGDLDLLGVTNFLGTDDPAGERNELYRNDGGLTFTAINSGDWYTAPAGQGATDVDYDDDGDIDIFAGNRTGDLNILQNDGYGVFTLISPAAIGITHQGREGATFGDIDNDGDLDMLLSDFDETANIASEHLYFNDGDGTFTFSTTFTNTVGYMAGFGDLDNDGDLDIVFSGDDKCYLNDGSGSFTAGPAIPTAGIDDPRAVALADIDNDGDLDFAIGAKRSRNWLVQNNLNGGKWLKVKLISPFGQAGAFGAKVKIYPGGQLGGALLGYREARALNGYLGQNDPVLHFGTGSNGTVDVVVQFLDGASVVQENVAVNQTLVIDGRSVGPSTPVVTSFTPASGVVGTTVTLTGENFVGSTEVRFNGVPGTGLTVVSDTELTVAVPSGASTGYLQVLDANGMGTSSTTFEVINPPDITSFTPSDGPVGTAVTLTGNGFTGVSQVQFNGTDAASFSIDSDQQITATVPNTATTGPVSVTNSAGTATSATDFTVTAVPLVSSFSPQSGVAGSVVTILGNNFTNATSVLFNGVASATVTILSDTELTASVPTGATTGKITVVNSAGSGISVDDFTVISLSDMEITINVDDEYELYVNGVLIGSDVNWDQAQTYTVPSVLGENVLAVRCTNPGGAGGLIAEVKLDGAVVLLTDTSWVYTATEEIGWTDIGFDDSSWLTAVDYGAYGADPWKTNIQGFPSTSTAHWIWETDSRGAGGYFRGSFLNGEAVPPPEVTSFTPASGSTGDVITITGLNFSGATQVQFNGVAASAFTVISDSAITATVPATTTGPISVTTAYGTGTSATDFTFIEPPGLTLTAPNGGETWLVSSVQTISWTSTGSIADVKLEYSADNGSTWQLLSASTPNDGAFDWTLPATASDLNLVRISDVLDASVADTSDAVFSIVEASLTLTSPNGGETLVAGAVQTITWTTVGTVDSVSLDYSTDNGTSWVSVAAPVSNSGSFDWTVPSLETTSALVRIRDAADGIPQDVSDAVFTITTVLGDMEVTINVDDAYDLYVNGNLVGSDTTWDQAQTYLVPAVSGKNVLAVFGSNPGGRGGLIAEVLFNGEVVLISDTSWVFNPAEEAGWQENGFDDSAWIPAVDYGVYGVAPWNTNIQGFPATSSAHWIWEADGVGPGGYFRGSFVVGQAGPPPEVTSFAPTSGTFGDTVTITGLNFTGATSVQFNGVPATAFTVVSDSEISATVPAGASTGKISVVNNSGTGTSVDDFVVNVTASLTLTSPNGGENFLVATVQTITWTSTGDIPLVRIEASFDNGATWSDITASTANDGSFDWTLPATPASESLVRISDAADGDPSDVSDAVFAITSSLGTMEITINVDDEYDLYVNGEFIGTDINWDQAQTYTATVLDGKNVIAVQGRNTGGAGAFIAEVRIDGQLVLQTDSTWKRIDVEQTDWFNPNFDDSAWFAAVDHGQYGVGPWNTNIVGFPAASTASWIWSADELDPVQFLRGTFYAGPPQIASFTPGNGPAGTEVTLTGTNFSATGVGNLNGSGTIRIMPLGNSITKGVTGSTDDAGYRNDLAELLDAQGIAYDFVGSQANGLGFDSDHEGHNGFWADEVLLELDSWLNLNPPDIVLFHIGTNDISSAQTNASTIDEIGQNLDVIKNFDPNIAVILSSLIPRKDSLDATTDDLNTSIAALVTARALAGDNIYYAGNNEAFKSDVNWATDYYPVDDNIHPNDTGYAVMAGVWFDAILNVLNDTQNLTVAFNGSIASNVVVDSDAQLRATVPDGATTGPITVTNLYGTASSATDFTVDAAAAAPSLTLTHPVGGEEWQSGSTHVVKWQSQGPVDYVNVEYSRDNGVSWQPLAEKVVNDGKFEWGLSATVPASADNVLVRVSDAQNATVAAKTARVLTVVQDSEAVTFHRIKEAVLQGGEAGNDGKKGGDLNRDGSLDVIDLLLALDANQNRRPRKGAKALLDAPPPGSVLSVASPEVVVTDDTQTTVKFAIRGDAPVRAFQLDLTFNGAALPLAEEPNIHSDTGMQLYSRVQNDKMTIVGFYLKEQHAEVLPEDFLALTGQLPKGRREEAEVHIAKALFVSADKQPLPMQLADETRAEEIPETFSLLQNYPNPFNIETQIRYALPQKSHVKIQIFNIRGELVRTLLDAEVKAGEHKIAWNGQNDRERVVASGIYIYRIKAGDWKAARKMTLVK